MRLLFGVVVEQYSLSRQGRCEMKVSKKRKSEVYKAIHSRITNLRVQLQLRYGLKPEVDFLIAQEVDRLYGDVIGKLERET
jgi:asparagine synthetase A